LVLLDDNKYFALTHDDQFFTINFDGIATGVSAEHNALAHSADFSLVGFFAECLWYLLFARPHSMHRAQLLTNPAAAAM
jgi:hypothetical protein